MTVKNYFSEALELHQLGDLKGAVTLYKKCIRLNINKSDSYHNIGIAEYQSNKISNAIIHIKIAIKIEPLRNQFWTSLIRVSATNDQINQIQILINKYKEMGLNLQTQEKLFSEKKRAQYESDINFALNLMHHGKYVESIVKCKKLLPNDIGDSTAYKIIAANYVKLNKYEEAIFYASCAINSGMDDGESNNIIGYAYLKKNQIARAEVYLKKAHNLSPNSLKILYNLTSLFLTNKNFCEANNYLGKIIAIDPNSYEAYKNLGNVEFFKKNYAKSKEYYEKSIAINPNYWATYNNLGILMHKKNEQFEAIKYFKKALSLCVDENKSAVLFGMASAHYVLGNTDLAKQIAIKATPKDVWGLDCLAFVAILNYINDDYTGAEKLCANEEHLEIHYDKKEHSLPVYFKYIKALIQSDYNCGKATKEISVIGESHALSAHGVDICFNGIHLKAKAKWILGVKAYHLGSKEDNYFKRQFLSHVNQLINGRELFLTIGEIDCRINEGIFNLYLQNRQMVNIEEIIEKTASSYIEFVANATKSKSLNVIVCGVPAPNIPLDRIDANLASIFKNMIRNFNESLKVNSLKNCLRFLDVYKMTDDGSGASNKIWHIDTMHLKKNAYVNAFEKYLI